VRFTVGWNVYISGVYVTIITIAEVFYLKVEKFVVICLIMKSYLKNFLDDEERINQWPAKGLLEVY